MRQVPPVSITVANVNFRGNKVKGESSPVRTLTDGRAMNTVRKIE